MKEAYNYKCYKRLITKQHLEVSGVNDIPLLSYLPKHFMQIYRAKYGDAMLVPIRMGANNQRKHVQLTSAIKVIALFSRASTLLLRKTIMCLCSINT